MALAETDKGNNLIQSTTLQKELGLPFTNNGAVSQTERKASALTGLLFLRPILS